PKRRTDLLFDDAVKEFLAWVEANRRWRTLRGYRQGLDALKPVCGGKRLGDLSPFLLEKHKRERLAVGARVAPNRELAALRALVNHCRKLGLYDGPNPVQGVAFLEEPRGRLRFLDEAEEARLVGAAAGEPLRTYILAGIHAGLRLNAEGLTLQWPDIDLRRGLLSVEAAYSKNRTKRVVPIN